MIINRKQAKAGLYIHIPFCLKKCRYCDFLSFEGSSRELREAYTDALVKELACYSGNGKRPAVDTVFIGGGTPSILATGEIGRILAAAERGFYISGEAEITIEANPKTLTEDKLSAYRAMGINRLSIGAQSMDNDLLSFMGRVHSSRDFAENFQAARDAGFDNINVDLMFGIPGQSRELWEDSLSRVLKLSPEHISFYSLQLEEGTEFCQMYKAGQMDLPPQEEEREMYHRGIDMLKRAGYCHYEISNSAKPGFECRHNLKYWNFDEYFAAGAGAHSFCYDRGRRFNTADLNQYIKRLQEGMDPVEGGGYEEESAAGYMGEYVFTALRTRAGVDTEDFEDTFGVDFCKVYGDKIEKLLQYREKGLLILEEKRIALTERGIDVSNGIMAEFV